MKKVGLYFGSFNPIHIGHLIIAEYFATQTELDEVWLVVSPHNPLKNMDELVGEHHRLEMVKCAVAGNNRVFASDIEFSQPKPSYSCNTLRILTAAFPQCAFTLILGEDNMPTFHKWKEYEFILENFPIKIFPRLNTIHDDEEIEWKKYDVQMIKAPRLEISSTAVRSLLKEGKSLRYLLPEEVIRYIGKHQLFV